MLASLRREKWWVAANLIGLAAYTWFCSWVWIEPELRNEPTARGGNVFMWALSALPVLLAFLVLDLIWLSITYAKAARSNNWRSMPVVMGVAVLWVAVVLGNGRLM